MRVKIFNYLFAIIFALGISYKSMAKCYHDDDGYMFITWSCITSEYEKKSTPCFKHKNGNTNLIFFVSDVVSANRATWRDLVEEFSDEASVRYGGVVTYDHNGGPITSSCYRSYYEAKKALRERLGSIANKNNSEIRRVLLVEDYE